MRCRFKSCGGLIVKQMAYGPYPERLYCQSCGREPKRGRDMPETPQTKTCGKCKIEKSIDEFGILRSSEDGHNPVYFDCKRRRDRNYKEKKFNKVKVSDHKPRSNKLKNVELPKEKIIAQHEEPAEAQLIRAFKKTTIKNFIKDLIPILEKAVEERFK